MYIHMCTICTTKYAKTTTQNVSTFPPMAHTESLWEPMQFIVKSTGQRFTILKNF